MITQEQIEAVKDKIVKEFDPEKIVLFGSYAYGEPNESSDLDLMVVKKSDEPMRILARKLHYLFLKRDFSMDLIVCKPEQVEEWKEAPAAFITGVMKHGKTLYEKY